MSKSFMYDLYFGNLSPWERERSENPAYHKISRKISDLEEHFRKQLSNEEFEKFEEIGDLRSQAGTIEDEEIFGYGFCMSALMMLDIFAFKEKHLTDL